MRSVLAFFVRNHIWSNAIIALTVLFGLISFYNMDRAFFPELEPVTIHITTLYPGASPEEMEEGITIKVEESLKGIAEIDEVTSSSSENQSMVTVKGFQGTDMDELLAEVKNAVDGISSFPVGAEKPIIYKLKTSDMSGRASYISLSGNLTLMEMKSLAEEIEQDLLNTGVISDVSISGYPETEFSIEVEEDALLRYGLTFDNVVAAVRNNNRDVTAGTIKTQEEELLIRAKAREIQTQEIEDIVLRSGTDGEYIRLGEVAKVHFQFSDVPNRTFLDGERTVTVEVKRRFGEDLKSISTAVADYVDRFNETHTEAELTLTFSFYDLLNQRIDLLTKNGTAGLVLVLIVLGLFLNIRLSAWVAFGIPFSFLGMFILGTFYGMSINMISLFGMILVVGILVDDGIVIAENIYAHFERGKTPMQAAIDGTLEVASSVFTSVLTTIVAFSVLLFIEGLENMAEMAFVVMAALGFSLIEAFLVLPAHLSSKRVMRTNVIGKLRQRVTRAIDFMRSVYADLLSLSIRYRRISVTLPLVFMIFIFSLLLNRKIQSTFFPSIPFDDFNVEVAFQPGERDAYTESFLTYCQEKVFEVRNELKEKYGEDIITYVSMNVGFTRNLGESGPHCGHINVNLDAEGYDISSFDVARMVQERIGPVRGAEKFMVGGVNRWGKPVSIAIQGDNYQQLKEATAWLKERLYQNSALKDVQDNSSSGKREVLIRLKPQAYMLGLDHNEISRQIRQGFYGEEAQRLIVGTDEARVWVRYPEKDRLSLGQLENMRIKTPSQQEIPITQLVDYSIERGDVSIKHYNGVREIEITADLVNPYASVPEILSGIRTDHVADLKATFDKVDIEFRGQQQNADKSLGSMAVLLSVALFLMILIISLNFNSLYQAIIILAVLPVGIFGAILGHGIEDKPVSILSAWGMIALMGILVNDAVVFLDTYNRNLKTGMDVKKAIYEAGMSRFRPIIMTSITTVVGLYPLILEKSFQAQFLVPMAISVAYGVLFGTYFILVFFPVLVLTFNDLKKGIHWIWLGRWKAPEELEPVIQHEKYLEEIKSH